MTEQDLLQAELWVRKKLEKLPAALTYHSSFHTFDVLEQCQRIARSEGIVAEQDLMNLRFAALYHDTGFLKTYIGHEKESCDIFLNDTREMDISKTDKEMITGLIMATKLPQQPHTLLQRILCDADLDYLGREDFFTISDNLRKEFIHYGFVDNDEEWHQLQINFLANHQYHTASCAAFRDPVKKIHLEKISHS